MSGIREKLTETLKEAMRARDAVSIRTIRLILAAVKDRDIVARGKSARQGIEDEDIMALLQTMIKQRVEASTAYEEGGRIELAEQEQQEIEVIRRFLPRQMEKEETDQAINRIVSELNASGPRAIGPVMQTLRERYKGQMDFSYAAKSVKALLMKE